MRRNRRSLGSSGSSSNNSSSEEKTTENEKEIILCCFVHFVHVLASRVTLRSVLCAVCCLYIRCIGRSTAHSVQDVFSSIIIRFGVVRSFVRSFVRYVRSKYVRCLLAYSISPSVPLSLPLARSPPNSLCARKTYILCIFIHTFMCLCILCGFVLSAVYYGVCELRSGTLLLLLFV